MQITRISVRVKDRESSNIRLYLVPDEESLFDNFVQGRLTRPYQEFRKSGLLDKTMKEIIGYPSGHAKWSQKAGCSCGCSPGFIVEKSAHLPTDYYIYYDVESLEEAVKLDEDTYNARAKTFADITNSSIDIIE